jgi:hypothetical protein
MDPGLRKKLQLKEKQGIHVLFSPFPDLETLPDDNNSVLLFIKTKADLLDNLKFALSKLGEEGLLWIAYPKKSSGIKTDISRDQGWEPLMEAGFGPVRQIAIDETWSALRWRPERDIKRKQDSTFRRDPAK